MSDLPLELLPCEEVVRVLEPAYRPCVHFENACQSMRWNPRIGHVPRGFFGALGKPQDVRVALVSAEPGDPDPREIHDESASTRELLATLCAQAYRYVEQGYDLFHRNLRTILEGCLPGMTFREQMHYAWITTSVLCSASREGARVPSRVAATCASSYLNQVLELFPDAIVIALGQKASDRMRSFKGVVVHASAAAPPGCNRPDARQSWLDAAASVRARFAG